MMDYKLKQNFTSGITLLKFETVGSRLCACPLLLNGMNKTNYFFYYQGVKKLHYIHKTVLILSIVLTLSWSLALDIAVSSEYYKYKDQKGVVHFTDDISETPKDQREKVTSFKFLTSEGVRPSSFLNEEKKDSFADQSEKEEQALNEGETIDDKLLETSELLEKERTQLEQTFENIQKKKAELLKKSMRKRTNKETKAYNQQVIKLNQDIKEYEKRHK